MTRTTRDLIAEVSHGEINIDRDYDPLVVKLIDCADPYRENIEEGNLLISWLLSSHISHGTDRLYAGRYSRFLKDVNSSPKLGELSAILQETGPDMTEKMVMFVEYVAGLEREMFHTALVQQYVRDMLAQMRKANASDEDFEGLRETIVEMQEGEFPKTPIRLGKHRSPDFKEVALHAEDFLKFFECPSTWKRELNVLKRRGPRRTNGGAAGLH